MSLQKFKMAIKCEKTAYFTHKQVQAEYICASEKNKKVNNQPGLVTAGHFKLC